MPSERLPNKRDFAIEESDQGSGRCECCAAPTKRVSGIVRRNGRQTAAYSVAWTVGKPNHGARFDLVLGQWGSSSSKSDRFSVALHFSRINDAPEFAIIDAKDDGPLRDLSGKALKRSDLLGTPLILEVFAIADAIYMSEGLNEVRASRDAEEEGAVP